MQPKHHSINKAEKGTINIKHPQNTRNNVSFYDQIDNITSNLKKNGIDQLDSKNSSFIINVSSRAASIGSGDFRFLDHSPKDDEIKGSDLSENEGDFD